MKLSNHLSHVCDERLKQLLNVTGIKEDEIVMTHKKLREDANGKTWLQCHVHFLGIGFIEIMGACCENDAKSRAIQIGADVTMGVPDSNLEKVSAR